MAKNLQRPVLALLAMILIPLPSLAFDNFKEFRRDRWDFELSTDYFHSEANYPSGGGSEQSLASGSSYSLTNFTFGTRYMPSREWSVFGATNIGNAEAKNSISTRTASSFTWALFGADFLMYSGLIDVVPEFALLVPFEQVDGTGDSALNSEGVFEGRTRVTLQKELGKIRGFGYLGLTFRSDDRSFLMPWGIGADYRIRRFRLGAELFGYQSISDDKDKKNPAARLAYLNTVNAGSFAFYSVNPAITDTNFYAQWVISSQWSLKAGAGMTLKGESAAAGYHVGALVRYSFDMTAGYRDTEPAYQPISSPVPKARSNLYYDEKAEKEVYFQADTRDGVDQRLFQPKPKKKKPRLNKKQQKMMEDAEFNIELKSKKKKKKR
ncbi:hypothetical protein D3C87_104710 [compost metagenome]